MNLNKTLAEYYSKRAKEYDEVYHRPDKIRLQEQRLLAEYITKTFKRRVLKSGEQFDILKNYYTSGQLKKIFSKYSHRLEIKYLTNFWIARYYI